MSLTRIQIADDELLPDCLICSGQVRPANLPGLVRCSSCGFVTTKLDITDEALKRIYGRDYFHGQEYLDYVAEAQSLRLNFQRRIEVLKKLDLKFANADVFEIGCAYGFFLQEVASCVRRASGLDISTDAVEHAVENQQVEALAANYLTFDLGRKVDVICLWDTIEHLQRPDLFVRKAAEDLKAGGLLAITTGDISSLNARLRGKSWRMIHPPTHLHYFSVHTLCRLLDAQGFDIVHVSHPGNSRKLRSVLYFFAVLKANRPAIYSLLHRLPVFNLNLTVNLFDIMYIVGRRRNTGSMGA